MASMISPLNAIMYLFTYYYPQRCCINNNIENLEIRDFTHNESNAATLVVIATSALLYSMLPKPMQIQVPSKLYVILHIDMFIAICAQIPFDIFWNAFIDSFIRTQTIFHTVQNWNTRLLSFGQSCMNVSFYFQ